VPDPSDRTVANNADACVGAGKLGPVIAAAPLEAPLSRSLPSPLSPLRLPGEDGFQRASSLGHGGRGQKV